jgi:hypothetical protein
VKTAQARLGALIALTAVLSIACASETEVLVSTTVGETTPSTTTANEITETTTVATDQVKATASTSATTTTATPKTTVAPTQSAMANPNIAKLPTGGGHEGRENHGDRETHSEGDDD